MKIFYALLVFIFVFSTAKANPNIQKTTSDWLEHQRTNIYLLTNSEPFNLARKHYSFWPSKWYQPDINGDGLSDFVIFGVNKPSNQVKKFTSDFDMCGKDECKDWAVPPFFLIAEKEDTKALNKYFRMPQKNEITYSNLVARTSGGKTIFVDFNGDGLDDIYVPTWGLGANKGQIDSLIISKDKKYIDIASDIKRMNVRSLRHWATAGDIDNDGDIDIIAGDLGENNGKGGAKIDCFINDGKGNFIHDFCLNIKSFTKNKYHSWGGTLFDIDADGDLDLWVSQTGKQPTIYLGNNTGKFSSDKKIEIDYPKSWPKKMRQIGYVISADIDNDGFVEIFFSVQGKGKCRKTYCGSYVGYFKNQKGKLIFKDFIFKKEETEKWIWSSTSMIVVKDLNNDGLKDVYLKRNYPSPIYLQNENGLFVNTPLNSGIKLFNPVVIDLKVEKKNKQISYPKGWIENIGLPNSNVLCKKAVLDSQWNNLKPKWVKSAKERGFTLELCMRFNNSTN